jgi:hypothetical protein
MSQQTPIEDLEARLRRVRYFRHGGGVWHSDPEAAENSLLGFVYDIPHFGACGVFPPFHLLNQFLLRGGYEGGMSPGATWEPFSLSPAEYRDLVEAVRAIPPDLLRDRPQGAHLPFTFDPEFDGPPETYPVRAEVKRWHRHVPPELKEYFAWRSAVCAKHREGWHAKWKRAGFMR